MSTAYLNILDDLLGGFVGVLPERFEGVQDGPVAGAAAEVAVHGLLHLFCGHLSAVLQQTGGGTDGGGDGS